MTDMKSGVLLSIIIIVLLLEALQAHPPQPQPGTGADRPFKLKRYAAPEPADGVSGNVLQCVDIGTGLRICKRVSDEETVFTVESNGTTFGKWPTVYGLTATGFEVLRGDIDADGDEEIIVANRDGVSCGLGVQYWTIFILPNPLREGFEQPLQFATQEYGPEGTFVKHTGDRRCHILVTHWEDAKRGNGLYLVGRWFRYKDGLLEPINGRTVLARRYLFGFQDERGNTYDDKRIPLLWFKNPKTEARRGDPLLSGWKEVSTVEGVVVDHSIKRDDAGIVTGRDIKVRLQTGVIRSLIEKGFDYDSSENEFNRLGEAASGIIYPNAYAPADSKRWMIGRRIRLFTYERRDKYSGLLTYRILWLF